MSTRSEKIEVIPAWIHKLPRTANEKIARFRKFHILPAGNIWKIPYLAGKIWKIPYLAGKIWNFLYLAGKIWKIPNLAGKIWNFPNLATHTSLLTTLNSPLLTYHLVTLHTTMNDIFHDNKGVMHLSMLSRRWVGLWLKAGHGGGDLTFFKNLPSNSLPTGRSFQSIATKFPHPGLHIAVKYPKAKPKKGTIKTSPNKALQSLFENVAASPKIHVPVTAAIILFNHNPCYTAYRVQKPLGKSPHFVS